MEKRECSKCGKQKPIKEFNWKYKSQGIRHPNCRDCTRKTTRDHYERNKEDYKKRAVEFTRKTRKSHCSQVVEYLKKHPCVDCGESDPVVLQFDHVRGKKKDCIGTMVSGAYSWQTIKDEIDKCEVRCANCHCRKTAKERGWKYKTGL